MFVEIMLINVSYEIEQSMIELGIFFGVFKKFNISKFCPPSIKILGLILTTCLSIVVV